MLMQFQQNGNQLINQEYIIQTDSIFGQGAQGQVFECRKKITVGPAIQLCAKIQIVKQETAQYIQRELEILQSLQQENNLNLVKTFLFTIANNFQPPRFITIMERCQGNMVQFQKLNSQMNEKDLEDFIQQILKGYKSLYDKNIVHRDIKPENILYTQQTKFIFKLADFGIGKLCKWQDKNTDLTQIGTLQYSAPEINQNCDQRDFTQNLQKLKQSNMKNWKSCVDIYSLGLIVYQLYFGKLPYESKKQQLQFLDQLKKLKKITLPQNISITNQNQKIIAFIQQSIVYFPDERITFEKLFNLFGIQFNQASIDQSKIFPNQQQVQQKLFGPFPVIQYNECSLYLQQLLLQNEKFYNPMTVSWILKVKKLFDNKDLNNLKSIIEELKAYFPFKDEYQNQYSSDYVKFQQQLQIISNGKLQTYNVAQQK